MSASRTDDLARAGYQAYHAALGDGTTAGGWDTAAEDIRQAWRAAITAVLARQAGPATMAQPVNVRPLSLECGDRTHEFFEKFTAGRSGALVVNDEHASGQHVVFGYAHGYWYVEDLRSTNGTWLNGRKIVAPQRVKKGDRVRIGHTVIMIVSA